MEKLKFKPNGGKPEGKHLNFIENIYVVYQCPERYSSSVTMKSYRSIQMQRKKRSQPPSFLNILVMKTCKSLVNLGFFFLVL